jgi:hypothetical protein
MASNLHIGGEIASTRKVRWSPKKLTSVIAKAGAFPACLSWPDRPGKQSPNSHGIASLAEVRSLAPVPAALAQAMTVTSRMKSTVRCGVTCNDN